MITSYYIDENNVLHTFVGDMEHITISDVDSDERAKELIFELENQG